MAHRGGDEGFLASVPRPLSQCAVALAVLLAVGCSSVDGGGGPPDALLPLQLPLGARCDEANPCPHGLFCSASIPGGFCTALDCFEADRGCGETGVCVPTANEGSFCLPLCGSAGCPDRFVCDDDDPYFACWPAVLDAGEPCNEATLRCAEGLVCVSADGGEPACRQRCELGADTGPGCAEGFACAALDGATPSGACIPLGTRAAGETCFGAVGSCLPDLRCVFLAADAASGVCRRLCAADGPACPEGQACVGLAGGDLVCASVTPAGEGDACDPTAFRLCMADLWCWQERAPEPGVCLAPCPACPAPGGVPLPPNARDYLSTACATGRMCMPDALSGGLCFPWEGRQPQGELCVRDTDCQAGLLCVFDTAEATAGRCEALCVPGCPTLGCPGGGACLAFEGGSALGYCPP